MEIERKYLIHQLPENLDQYPHYEIEQGYLNTDPVIRIRRQGDEYVLTYKSRGFLARKEYNLPLTKEAYEHMRPKTDGIFISKTRYVLPLCKELQIELDLFHTPYEELFLAEVEFPDEKSARSFTPPSWFGEDVTFSAKYQNSTLSKGTPSGST